MGDLTLRVNRENAFASRGVGEKGAFGTQVREWESWLPARDIPDLEHPAAVRTRQDLAIRREGKRLDIRPVSLKAGEFLSGGDVLHPDTVIVFSGGEDFTVG